jgi:hypothetical protein
MRFNANEDFCRNPQKSSLEIVSHLFKKKHRRAALKPLGDVRMSIVSD